MQPVDLCLPKAMLLAQGAQVSKWNNSGIDFVFHSENDMRH